MTNFNAMREDRKGQECRGCSAEKRELDETKGGTKNGPDESIRAGRKNYVRENYFWPALNESFSVPTTGPCRVPGMRVSRSASPVLASAMVTRLTSRVRPTARS